MPHNSRRAMYRAAGNYVRQHYPHRVTVPARPAIAKTLTRDECLHETRTLLDDLRWMRRDPVRQLRGFEVRALLFAARAYREEAMQRPPIPSGRAFYVSIREAARQGLLYGPFVTQLAALRQVRRTKALALDLNHSDAAFASFGTASVAIERARPGLLNDRLPPLPPIAPATPAIAHL